MRKCIATLMASLLSCSAAFGFWPEAAESSFSLGVGYRQDRLDWKTKADIGFIENEDDSDITGAESKLRWKNLEIWQIQAKAKYITCDNIYFRAYGNYGWITDGTVTDKDYLTHSSNVDVSDELLFSGKADADHGHVYDVSLGIGYQFRMCDDTIALTPVVGYSWEGQHLKLEDGEQSFPSFASIGDLNSSYKTRWYGPWLGLDFDYRLCYDWTLFATYEYHWATYRARGDWNLREDIIGDFHHRSSRAYGNLVSIGVEWEFCECWVASLTGQWQWWRAKHGRDSVKVLHESEGDVDFNCYVSSPLNQVTWQSASVTFDIGMIF